MSNRHTPVRRAIFFAALCAALVPAAVRAESAREMLDRAKTVNDAREPKDFSEQMKMTLIDSRGGSRVRDLAVYGRNEDPQGRKRILFFLSPPEVRGVGFLSWSVPGADDDQWLYLPELKRVRQISGAGRRHSFQGSDFSYDDLRIFDDIRDWTEDDAQSRLLREGETIDGVSCAVIELVPQGKSYEYRRLVLWLDRGDSTFRKIELYDEKDGALLKTLTLSDFATIDGVPTARHLEMANAKRETRTIVEISEIRYNRNLPADAFTERALERGRVE